MDLRKIINFFGLFLQKAEIINYVGWDTFLINIFNKKIFFKINYIHRSSSEL